MKWPLLKITAWPEMMVPRTMPEPSLPTRKMPLTWPEAPASSPLSSWHLLCILYSQ